MTVWLALLPLVEFVAIRDTIRNKDQHDLRAIDDNLTHFAKVNGNFPANIRLYLPHAPIRLGRMADNHAWLKYRIQVGHFIPTHLRRRMMRTELATLVGSRICHDLISPIGAIGNGVELLGHTNMTGDSSPEMDLISESVENANARIRFFRIAYGSPSSKHAIGRKEVLSVLAGSARGGRLNYFWQIEGDQSRGDVQIAFLLMQCFETALPLGGDVHIHLEGEKWVLKAQGPRLNVTKTLWESLTDQTVAVEHTASQVQFALLPCIASEVGKSLDVNISTDSIRVQF